MPDTKVNALTEPTSNPLVCVQRYLTQPSKATGYSWKQVQVTSGVVFTTTLVAIIVIFVSCYPLNPAFLISPAGIVLFILPGTVLTTSTIVFILASCCKRKEPLIHIPQMSIKIIEDLASDPKLEPEGEILPENRNLVDDLSLEKELLKVVEEKPQEPVYYGPSPRPKEPKVQTPDLLDENQEGEESLFESIFSNSQFEDKTVEDEGSNFLFEEEGEFFEEDEATTQPSNTLNTKTNGVPPIAQNDLFLDPAELRTTATIDTQLTSPKKVGSEPKEANNFTQPIIHPERLLETYLRPLFFKIGDLVKSVLIATSTTASTLNTFNTHFKTLWDVFSNHILEAVFIRNQMEDISAETLMEAFEAIYAIKDPKKDPKIFQRLFQMIELTYGQKLLPEELAKLVEGKEGKLTTQFETITQELQEILLKNPIDFSKGKLKEYMDQQVGKRTRLLEQLENAPEYTPELIASIQPHFPKLCSLIEAHQKLKKDSEAQITASKAAILEAQNTLMRELSQQAKDHRSLLLRQIEVATEYTPELIASIQPHFPKLYSLIVIHQKLQKDSEAKIAASTAAISKMVTSLKTNTSKQVENEFKKLLSSFICNITKESKKDLLNTLTSIIQSRVDELQTLYDYLNPEIGSPDLTEALPLDLNRIKSHYPSLEKLINNCISAKAQPAINKAIEKVKTEIQTLMQTPYKNLSAGASLEMFLSFIQDSISSTEQFIETDPSLLQMDALIQQLNSRDLSESFDMGISPEDLEMNSFILQSFLPLYAAFFNPHFKDDIQRLSSLRIENERQFDPNSVDTSRDPLISQWKAELDQLNYGNGSPRKQSVETWSYTDPTCMSYQGTISIFESSMQEMGITENPVELTTARDGLAKRKQFFIDLRTLEEKILKEKKLLVVLTEVPSEDTSSTLPSESDALLHLELGEQYKEDFESLETSLYTLEVFDKKIQITIVPNNEALISQLDAKCAQRSSFLLRKAYYAHRWSLEQKTEIKLSEEDPNTAINEEDQALTSKLRGMYPKKFQELESYFTKSELPLQLIAHKIDSDFGNDTTKFQMETVLSVETQNPINLKEIDLVEIVDLTAVYNSRNKKQPLKIKELNDQRSLFRFHLKFIKENQPKYGPDFNFQTTQDQLNQAIAQLTRVIDAQQQLLDSFKDSLKTTTEPLSAFTMNYAKFSPYDPEESSNLVWEIKKLELKQQLLTDLKKSVEKKQSVDKEEVKTCMEKIEKVNGAIKTSQARLSKLEETQTEIDNFVGMCEGANTLLREKPEFAKDLLKLETDLNPSQPTNTANEKGEVEIIAEGTIPPTRKILFACPATGMSEAGHPLIYIQPWQDSWTAMGVSIALTAVNTFGGIPALIKVGKKIANLFRVDLDSIPYLGKYLKTFKLRGLNDSENKAIFDNILGLFYLLNRPIFELILTKKARIKEVAFDLIEKGLPKVLDEVLPKILEKQELNLEEAIAGFYQVFDAIIDCLDPNGVRKGFEIKDEKSAVKA